MRAILPIVLVFLAPVLVVAGVYAFGLSIPVPQLGRDYVLRFVLPDAERPLDLPEVLGPEDASRPLVVIDAGHGGPDGGASQAGIMEKRIALGLALALRDKLLEQGGVRVALTRDDDTFVVLGERAVIARRLGADLFISIHADSAANEGAGGATIYTLDDDASDAVAARFAARENAAARVNGVALEDTDPDVSAILVDLSQRRVEGESREFADLIIREGEGRIAFNPAPYRRADLAVLKNVDIPAVLFEAGFITNAEDARRLTSPEARLAFAEALGRAIRIYFARELAGEG